MNKTLTRAVATAFTSAALLLPAAAFAQTGGAAGTSGGTSGATTGAMTGSAAAGSARAGSGELHRADRRFLEEAAQSDLAEIATSRVAVEKAAGSSVKKYAQHMIDDHSKTSEQLKTLAKGKGVDLPTEPDRAHQRVVEKLQKTSGGEFDRDYMRGQVRDHQRAVRLFERQAKDGRDLEIKAFATQTLPNLRQHLQMARSEQSGSDGKTGSHGAGGSHAGKGGAAGMSGSTGSGAAGMSGATGSGATGSGTTGAASGTGSR